MRWCALEPLDAIPTGAVRSNATTLPEIVQEMLLSRTSERRGRVIDCDTSALWNKKREGYF